MAWWAGARGPARSAPACAWLGGGREGVRPWQESRRPPQPGGQPHPLIKKKGSTLEGTSTATPTDVTNVRFRQTYPCSLWHAQTEQSCQICVPSQPYAGRVTCQGLGRGAGACGHQDADRLMTGPSSGETSDAHSRLALSPLADVSRRLLRAHRRRWAGWPARKDAARPAPPSPPRGGRGQRTIAARRVQGARLRRAGAAARPPRRLHARRCASCLYAGHRCCVSHLPQPRRTPSCCKRLDRPPRKPGWRVRATRWLALAAYQSPRRQPRWLARSAASHAFHVSPYGALGPRRVRGAQIGCRRSPCPPQRAATVAAAL